MSYDTVMSIMRQQIEIYLRETVNNHLPDDMPEYKVLKEMLLHHMGWTGSSVNNDGGKRIRPLLVLLSATCYSENWHYSLPAASAIELIHNFSLIHDDIEDNSELRRGRETVWKRWGIAQGINAGDLMFSIAQSVCADMVRYIEPERVVKILTILNRTCVELTKGQYLDMAYEALAEVSQDKYLRMIQGKTASLISCSCKIGALTGGAGDSDAERFAEFGRNLGLAFQVKDDWLGIWGDEAVTGKSAESDLIVGKKTLPVILGLMGSDAFRVGYIEKTIDHEQAAYLTRILESTGIKERIEAESESLTRKALKELEDLDINELPYNTLIAVANQLTLRNK